jgi:hypothetical protein
MVMLLALILASTQIDNPQIDMDGYLRVANEAAKFREARRVSEDEFLELAAQPGTIILDARSTQMYRAIHVKGAINLTFSDIAVRSLADLIPDKSTRILIYCNNNFRGMERYFATKAPQASLNLSTFIALYTYGYRNVYELGPNVEVTNSKLPFEGTAR